MAVESFMSGVLSNLGTKISEYIFELATMISGSTNFEIIDSYSSASTPTRYKGDPVADAIWTGYSSVGALNSWIVIQPTAPTYSPGWQVKFQGVDTGAGAFDDPSGHDYGYEGTTDSALYWRFSPYGGWSLADTGPDFDSGVDPATQVSQNRQTIITTAWSSGLFGIFMGTGDADTLILFARSYNIYYYALDVIGYFGDYTPPASITQTAKHRCALSSVGYAQHLELSVIPGNNRLHVETAPDSFGTQSYIWFIQPDDVGRYIKYTTVPCDKLCTAANSPDRVSPSSVPLYPIYFRGDYFYPNIAGKLRLLAKNYGIGKMRRFASNTWLSTWHAYSVAIKWDGTVDPWPIP